MSATATATRSKKLITPIGRVSYPALFEARASEDGGTPKYSITLIFDKEAQATEAYQALRAEVAALLAKHWPDKDKRPESLRLPFRKAGEKEGQEGYEDGFVFIKASSKDRPEVVDARKNKLDRPDQIPAGYFARASVSVFAYGVTAEDRKKTKGGVGISLGLGNVQLVREGPLLGNRTRAADDFDTIDVPDATDQSDLDEMLS